MPGPGKSGEVQSPPKLEVWPGTLCFLFWEQRTGSARREVLRIIAGLGMSGVQISQVGLGSDISQLQLCPPGNRRAQILLMLREWSEA